MLSRTDSPSGSLKIPQNFLKRKQGLQLVNCSRLNGPIAINAIIVKVVIALVSS